MADYQQGQVKNIRTAAEANMIRSAIEGRLAIRSRKVVRIVTSMFRRALDAFKWALVNKEFSGVNVDRLSRLLQVDVDAATFEREIVEASPAFRLLPFSPLMEDKITRRAHLIELISYLSSGGPLSDAIDQQELAREVVEAFGFRPSLVKTETVDELVALQESVSPEAQAIEELAAMGGSPEMPPMGMPPIPQG